MFICRVMLSTSIWYGGLITAISHCRRDKVRWHRENATTQHFMALLRACCIVMSCFHRDNAKIRDGDNYAVKCRVFAAWLQRDSLIWPYSVTIDSVLSITTARSAPWVLPTVLLRYFNVRHLPQENSFEIFSVCRMSNTYMWKDTACKPILKFKLVIKFPHRLDM